MGLHHGCPRNLRRNARCNLQRLALQLTSVAHCESGLRAAYLQLQVWAPPAPSAQLVGSPAPVADDTPWTETLR
eukprot:1838073-Alexandrium_andersonii.AAC.1